MSPLIATFVYGFAIYILFALEREKGRKISPVLYIPALYLFTNGSRPLAFWLGMQSGDAAALTQEGSPLDVLVALGLMIAGIVVLMKRQAAIARLLQANAAVMPFLMYCAISCSWSDDPIIAFKRWFRFLGTFITVLVILTDSDPSRALKWALTRVGFLLIPISVLLIKYYPWIARSYDPWTGRQMVSGVATDKNMLGIGLSGNRAASGGSTSKCLRRGEESGRAGPARDRVRSQSWPRRYICSHLLTR